MNSWQLIALGIVVGFAVGCAYGQRLASGVFAKLNERGMEEMGKAIASIEHLREQIALLKEKR